MNKLLSKKLTFVIGAFFSVLAAGHAFANSSYRGVMKSVPYSTLMFDSGSSTLTDAHKQKLRNLVQNSTAKGKIDQITVAAWSDKNFPAKSEVELTDSDRALAERRLDIIETFLKDELAVEDVDTFNMASQSNWLAKTFHSDDAELKSIFSKKGADAPVTKAEFQIIKNEGGPYEAVIVVERVIK